MQIEEGPFVIIKDYRKIVVKAKNDKNNDKKNQSNEFTTHESIPQNIKDQINQILFQLTQPQKFNDQNKSKMTQNDDYMYEQDYFYYQKYQQQKREETYQEITDIEQFLTLQENQKF